MDVGFALTCVASWAWDAGGVARIVGANLLRFFSVECGTRKESDVIGGNLWRTLNGFAM
jgi:hypothetical protein